MGIITPRLAFKLPQTRSWENDKDRTTSSSSSSPTSYQHYRHCPWIQDIIICAIMVWTEGEPIIIITILINITIAQFGHEDDLLTVQPLITIWAPNRNQSLDCEQIILMTSSTITIIIIPMIRMWMVWHADRPLILSRQQPICTAATHISAPQTVARITSNHQM